ncbi:MAG: DUF1648 domain-containing protein [Gammaproteobacteria bacterium]
MENGPPFLPFAALTTMYWPKKIFIALTAIVLLQSVFYYPKMPAVVASHFDAQGAANGWSGKEVFFGLYLAIVLLLFGVFGWVPKWIESRPGKSVNIPNRDYWLAPERRAETWAFFRRQMMLMGDLHLLLAIFAFQLAILANFDRPPRLHPAIGWALAFYFIVFTAWLIHFFLHFKRP